MDQFFIPVCIISKLFQTTMQKCFLPSRQTPFLLKWICWETCCRLMMNYNQHWTVFFLFQLLFLCGNATQNKCRDICTSTVTSILKEEGVSKTHVIIVRIKVTVFISNQVPSFLLTHLLSPLCTQLSDSGITEVCTFLYWRENDAATISGE